MTAKEARENTREKAAEYLEDLGILDTIRQTLGYVYIYKCEDKETVRNVVTCIHILKYGGGQIGNSLEVKIDWSI
jgi:hypothetical protein